jgi:hypothetical protein
MNARMTNKLEQLVSSGHGHGGGSIHIHLTAPNYVGSIKDLEAGMLQSARSGGMKKVLREVGVKV